MKLPLVDGKARFTGRPQDIHGIAVNVPGKSFTKERRQSSRKCRLKPGQVTRETTNALPLKSNFLFAAEKVPSGHVLPPSILAATNSTKRNRNDFLKITHRYIRVASNSRDSDIRIRKQNFIYTNN